MFKLLAASGIYTFVRHLLRLWTVALLCLTAMPGKAAHTQVRIFLAAETARPGETVLAGVHLRMDQGWHTYWKNSGGSGMPTEIEWRLPAGVTAGQIQWPVPEKLPDQELTTYIYSNDVVLLVPIKLAPDLAPGKIELNAKVKWLECETQCIPGSTNVQAVLNVGAKTIPSKEIALIETWQKKLPKSDAGLSPHAWWENAAKNDLRPLILEWDSATAVSPVDFFPYSIAQAEVQPLVERLPSDAGKIRIRFQVKKFEGDWPRQIAGVLVQQSGPERSAYEMNLPIETSKVPVTAQPGSEIGVMAPSLWKMLLYAFIGGLILNIMPCVLPVIALKILGFVGQAKEEPGKVRKLGLIYALGVLVSFLLLAALVIAVKAAGHKAGWGMQFGNPEFLLILTVLVTLVALNLFGLFEINLSGSIMGAAGTLASRQGAVGAFFNGVLATVLATPCTAPFLGAALGFAFAQSAGIIVLIFLTVGFGLAAPYVILSWHPAWLRFLPKPGAWMEKFKIAMGFPMLATAFWLLSLIPIHYGERAWWFGVFLVIVALAAWIFGEFVQRGRSRRGFALVVAAALLIMGYAMVVEGHLRWRSPDTGDDHSAILKNAPRGLPWRPWSPEAVASARAEGHPVLVDFTATWCPNCKAIVQPTLENSKIQTKIAEINATLLLGDYTRFPDNITDELNKFKRAGVPMVLVYPKDPKEPPIVFDVVFPGKLLQALEQAAK